MKAPSDNQIFLTSSFITSKGVHAILGPNTRLAQVPPRNRRSPIQVYKLELGLFVCPSIEMCVCVCVCVCVFVCVFVRVRVC